MLNRNVKPFNHTDQVDNKTSSKTPTYSTSNLKAIKGLFAFEDSDSGETPQKKLSKNTGTEKKRITIKDLDKRYDKKQSLSHISMSFEVDDLRVRNRKE